MRWDKGYKFAGEIVKFIALIKAISFQDSNADDLRKFCDIFTRERELNEKLAFVFFLPRVKTVS